MLTRFTLVLALLAGLPATAQETRHLDAHEHGVGRLNIAMEGQTITMELQSPGADIIGFEHAPKSPEDHAAVAKAAATLARPLELFALPERANCSVTQADSSLEMGHGHSEFHGAYLLHCSDMDAVNTIDFTYFEVFPGAQSLEVQVVTPNGSWGTDVTRDAPSVDLGALF